MRHPRIVDEDVDAPEVLPGRVHEPLAVLAPGRAGDDAKRGGALRQVSFEETAVVSNQRAAELIALDDALKDLAAFDMSKSRIVELRFFGGLTNEEVGEVMGMSLRTVEREWRKAKAWLRRAISKG